MCHSKVHNILIIRTYCGLYMLDWAEGGGGGAWAAWLTTGLVTNSILFC